MHKLNGDGGKPVTVSAFFNHDHTVKQDMYDAVPPLTRALVCDHLDKIGKLVLLLRANGFKTPDGYQRFAKYVVRDTKVPRTRASGRAVGRKQEYIKCPIRNCDDRTGTCDCKCFICIGIKKECGCCQTCNNIKGGCICPQ